MSIKLTAQQQARRDEFAAFAAEAIAPHADEWDRQERLPPEIITKLRELGCWGATVPAEYGGGGMDIVTYGLLHEAIGAGCSSLRSILTVHAMVVAAISKWGTPTQKETYLPSLATGELLGAFALSEPMVGSDAKHVQTTATESDEGYRLNGTKKWMTGGQIADLFLTFAQLDGNPAAFLVQRSSRGFLTKPISGLLGLRAAMLAELRFEDCEVPRESLLGPPGMGFNFVATTALDMGRYTVAWGCVGIIQACLDACLDFTRTRRQFKVPIKDHQLVKRLMSRMLVAARVSRLLCMHAGLLKDSGDPSHLMETVIAKYETARLAARTASDAVQLHGGLGCSSEYPVQRYFRDAKIMEIIEGTSQILEAVISDFGYQAQRQVESP